MKKITSILASFLMLFGMGLQAAPTDLPEVSTKDAPKWYVIDNYRGDALTAVNGKIEHHPVTSTASVWYFETSGDGVALVNADGTKVAKDYSLKAEGATWYILPNGANENGLCISKTNPISGGSCMDANNWNTGIGTYQPSGTDWQGTTWTFVSFETVFNDAIASMESPLMGTLLNDAEVKARWQKYYTSGTAEGFFNFLKERGEYAKIKMPVEGKTYLVKSAYAEYMNKQGVEKALYDNATKPMWKTLNNTDESFYWKIVPQGEGYTLQNLSTGKYIKALDATSEVAGEAAAIKMENLGNNKFKLSIGNDAMHTNNHDSGNGQEGNIVGWWGNPWGSSDWYVEETEWSDPVQVFFDYYVDDVLVATSEATTVKGGDKLVCPKQSNTFVTYEVEAGVATQGMHAKVNCIEHLPFAKSADLENANWYVVDIHSNEAVYYWTTTTDGVNPMIKKMADRSDVSLVNNSAYHWCFIGNVLDGFKIVNQKTGKALTEAVHVDPKSPSTFVNLEEGALWKLAVSTQIDGAVAFTANGTHYINKQKHSSISGENVYGFMSWSEPDAGSSCRFFTDKQIQDNAAEIKANALITNAENQNLAPAGYVGSSIYLSNAENAKAYATALANLKANKTDAAAFDALQAEYDKVVAAGAIAIEPNKYYRLQNVKRVNTGILTVGADGVLTNEDSNISNANNIWKFTKLENGKYNLVNANFGMGITEPSAHKIAAESAAEYELIDQTAGQFSLKSGNFLVQYQDQVGEIGSWGSAEKGGDGAWYIIPATELEVSMNKAEGAAESWSTLYLPFDVTLPNGVKAYQAAAPVAGAMSLTEVTTVPANNAVILNGQETKYTLNIAPATENKLAGNVLVGSNVESDQVAAEGTYMVLSKDVEGNVGLFKAPADMKLGANKAYYIYNEAAAVNGLKFVFGETTGVEGVEVETENAVFYDLSGRRVANPVKGIYVKNGKKVYVK